MEKKLINRDRHRDKRENEVQKTKEFNKKRKEANFEKGDTWALLLAALTTILPVAIIVVDLIWFFMAAIFGLFR